MHQKMHQNMQFSEEKKLKNFLVRGWK